MFASTIKVTGRYRCHKVALTISVIIIILIHISQMHLPRIERIQTRGPARAHRDKQIRWKVLSDNSRSK
jgi:hypothetical protein